MKRNAEHAYIRIGKDITAGRIPAVVLMYGEEDFLVNFYAETLIHKYVDKACEALDMVTLDRNRLSTKEIVENLETLPLMSERKVVYIPDFFDTKAKLPKLFAEGTESIEELTKYLEELELQTDAAEKSKNNDSVQLLLITIPKMKDNRDELSIKNSKLYKSISKIGAVYEFNALDDAQTRGFIEKRFHRSGKQFRPGIVSLIQRETAYGEKGVDYGLFALDNDLKKIIAHCGRGDEITKNDILSVIATSPDNNVFNMIDAISQNKKDEAFRLLHNLLEDGNNEYRLLAQIIKQLELMLATCEMNDKGRNLRSIQDELKKKDKIHEFRTKKAHETGRRFGTKKLKMILSSAYQVDENIKTGLMQGQLALEYFIAGI